MQISKKIIGLIVLVVAILITACIILVQTNKTPEKSITSQPHASPTPGVISDTVISMQAASQELVANQPSKINILVDAGTNEFSGAQFTLTYDPKVLENVKVTPGTYLQSPSELWNVVDPVKGTIAYTLAMSPGSNPSTGKGVLAVISYSVVPGTTASETTIGVDQSNAGVSDWRIKSSVLKSISGTTISLHSQ
jgi:hypothetical protein